MYITLNQYYCNYTSSEIEFNGLFNTLFYMYMYVSQCEEEVGVYLVHVCVNDDMLRMYCSSRLPRCPTKAGVFIFRLKLNLPFIIKRSIPYISL